MRLHQKRELTVRADLGAKLFDRRPPRGLMVCGEPMGLCLVRHVQILKSRALIDAKSLFISVCVDSAQ